MARQEGTEEPTPRKLERARKEGMVARSVDLVSFVVLLIASFALPLAVRDASVRIGDVAAAAWSGAIPATSAGALRFLGTGLDLVVQLVGPVAVVAVVIVAVGNLAQVGLRFVPKRLRPRAETFSPAANLRRIFSAQPGIEVAKAIVKLVATAAVAAAIVSSSIDAMAQGASSPLAAADAAAGASLELVRVVAVLGVVLGIVDLVRQRRSLRRRLRMTRHEVRDELREHEGDLAVKARRRRLAREFVRRAMLADVAQADVVVVNPTHVAVALRYDPRRDRAPTVVAKGLDHLAMTIRERARAARVPIVEDPPARARRLRRLSCRRADPCIAVPRRREAPRVRLSTAVAGALVRLTPRDPFRRHSGRSRRSGLESARRRDRYSRRRARGPRTLARRTEAPWKPRWAATKGRPVDSTRLRRMALAVPVGIAVIVIMLVVPMPSQLLDVLITANLTFALIVLGLTLRVRDPLDFSAFPSVLLVATMFRLALNVSATRLVLLHAYAGSVIEAFGHFVVGGSVVVGLVVFAILFIIQFVVITNGAGRVAEVGARFTLDAMPGKQMAIDADLNAGHISEAEARARRARIAREADFYGAMDGASKFVKGDAVAAAVITLINLIGGFIVGIVEHHLSVSQSIDTYSLLSVGDGLVSQIPALLLSISTGLMVTRSANDADFGLDLLRQIAHEPVAIQLAGG